MTQKLLLAFCLFPLSIYAASDEGWYARKAQAEYGGELEVVLADKSRVDLLTETHAYEIEFAPNWKEGVGKSLHYSLVSKRKAGIILVMTGSAPEKHLAQLKAVIEAYGLPIEVIRWESL